MSGVSIPVAELFTPAPSGVSNAGAVPSASTAASGSWLATEYGIASIIGMPTTSWQSGAPERTIFAITAVALSMDDALISAFAQGAFLSSAASGSVTYQTLNNAQLVTVTAPVTPDPSIPSQNSTGAPGWLDALGQNVYDVTRLSATYATGPLAIVNTSTSTVGPYSIGTYHVAAVNGATYNNASGIVTVPPSLIAGGGGTITGITTGTQTYISTGTAHGLAVGQSVYVNVPASSAVSGLAGVFALVAAVPSTTQIVINVLSSGTYSGTGGLLYLCTVATMTADVIGTSGSAALNSVTTTVTQNAGVYCSNVVQWAGNNYESNAAYATRCTLSLAAASPNGANAAYVYFALSAYAILAAQTPAIVLTNGAITSANAIATPATGVVFVYVASSTPNSTTLGQAVTPGFAQATITGVSNATAAVITVSSAIASWSGTMTVTISGVLNVAGVNGTFAATWLTGTTFSIPLNTIGAGAYSGGGVAEGGDLGQVDALLQANVVPDGTTAITQSALAFPITVLATVTVPQAYASTYLAAAQASLATYLGSLPIGGVYSTTSTVPVSYEEIVAALIDAGVLTFGAATYVRGTPSVTLNGGVVDVAFPSNNYQALLSSSTVITVVGV